MHAALLAAVLLADGGGFTRILLPLTGTDVAGVNGALWRTGIRAVVRGAAPVDLRPAGSVLADVSFDPRDAGIVDSTHPNGQFVYVRRSDAPRLQVSSRVWDVARETETAGSEIRIVREEQFTSARVSLIGIPVAAQYRHTLRVYELSATAGASVRVRLFVDDERAARVETVQTLSAPAAQVDLDGETKPAHPGFLQLDLRRLHPLDDARSLRIDIEPVDRALRLWSFVSITNNDTHHVTTFSQR